MPDYIIHLKTERSLINTLRVEKVRVGKKIFQIFLFNSYKFKKKIRGKITILELRFRIETQLFYA